jgi:ABC-type bacteriocin/lantibiotic exporter with double-glycine peptidase domain
MIENYKKIFIGILYVSRITKTNKKKLKILFSVILANLSVYLDIGTIVILTSLLVGNINVDNVLVEYFVQRPFLLPVIIVLRFLFNFIEKTNLKNLELEVHEKLRSYLLSEVFNKSNYSISDSFYFINIVSNHIAFFYGALASLINAGLQLIIYLAYLIYTDFDTVTLFLGAGLLLFLPTRFLTLKGRKFMDESYNTGIAINTDVEKIIDNMFLIKILGKTQEEVNRFREKLTKFRVSELKNSIYGTINASIPQFIALLVLSILVVFFELAKFITLDFMGIIYRLFQSFGSFNQSLSRVVNSHVHLDHLYKIDKNKVVIRNNYFDQNVQDMGRIALKAENVYFEYFNSDEPIFSDLNIEFEKKKHTIITGPNGTGKSTILGILSGVLYPEKGNLYSFTNRFGYIGVTPLIISGTLRDNLIYGSSNPINDEKMLNIIKNFKLFNEIVENPLDLLVSNKSLSSGQMQKVSFMRAILSDVEILFLDESTSNLDDESRTLIFNLLKNTDITIINSTHNPENFDYDSRIRVSVVGQERISILIFLIMLLSF